MLLLTWMATPVRISIVERGLLRQQQRIELCCDTCACCVLPCPMAKVTRCVTYPAIRCERRRRERAPMQQARVLGRPARGITPQLSMVEIGGPAATSLVAGLGGDVMVIAAMFGVRGDRINRGRNAR